ncbi:MAG TPA: hypothetical protein VF403_15800 [Kofleriaceae bacterium]
MNPTAKIRDVWEAAHKSNLQVARGGIRRTRTGFQGTSASRVASPERRILVEKIAPDRYPEIGLRFTGTATTPLLRPSVILDDETRDAIRIRR